MEGRCSTNAFNEQSKVTITDDDDIQSGSEECKESADDSYQTSGLQSSKRKIDQTLTANHTAPEYIFFFREKKNNHRI